MRFFVVVVVAAACLFVPVAAVAAILLLSLPHVVLVRISSDFLSLPVVSLLPTVLAVVAADLDGRWQSSGVAAPLALSCC